MTDADHVYVRNTQHGTHLLGCRHCGATYEPSLPCPMNVFLAQMQAFGDLHRDCPAPPPAGPDSGLDEGQTILRQRVRWGEGHPYETLACDGRCDQAWGINGRPREQFPDAADEDDYYWLSDDELPTAPANTGVWEGGHGKPSAEPLTDASLMNKWCARECERSGIFPDGEPISLTDFSKRQPNYHSREVEL